MAGPGPQGPQADQPAHRRYPAQRQRGDRQARAAQARLPSRTGPAASPTSTASCTRSPTTRPASPPAGTTTSADPGIRRPRRSRHFPASIRCSAWPGRIVISSPASGRQNRTCVTSFRAAIQPDLREGPLLSDREGPFVTGVNGTLMARRPCPALGQTALRPSAFRRRGRAVRHQVRA